VFEVLLEDFRLVHLWLLWFLIISLFCPGQAAAEPGSEITQLYREGERLLYEVTWLGIKAGSSTLEARGVVTLDGHQAYHLVTTAQSAPFISKFFRVEDRSESYLGTSPMQTLRFEKHLREGSYRHSSQTVFDHKKGIATFRYLDFGQVPRNITRLEEAERYGKYVFQEFPLEPGALDELSVLYYVRTMPLVPGTTTQAKVFSSRKSWELEVKVTEREILETVVGRRQTIVVEPLLKFEGIFQQKGRVIVWITDDPERIPVQMKSEVKIGSFVATLMNRQVGLSQDRREAQGAESK
jgi:hypothetical protein